MNDFEIGAAKRGRRAYSFDDIAIVPSRRTRDPEEVSIAWQIVPYLIITASEVMVSITGLEFAYTQAPRAMKSTIMSLWLLTVTFGTWIAAPIEQMGPMFKATFGVGEAFEFYMYAGMMVIFSCLFVVAAMRYRARDYVEKDGANALHPA